MLLNGQVKGFPLHRDGINPLDIGRLQLNLLRGDLPAPIAFLRESALTHNIEWMRRFCEARDIDIAPHGKTTMSPEIFKRQLDAGAWGLSFATVYQAAVGVRAGARRIIIANQVFQRADLDALMHVMNAYHEASIYFLIDSEAQIEAIEAWAANAPAPKPFCVLLEVGLAGKRTGVRSAEAGIALARRIHASASLRLCGIECYEGALATCNSEVDTNAVAELMAELSALATQCDTEALYEAETVLLTAGGSSIFDLVAEHLHAKLSKPTRRILRSGCYVTHDHMHYREHLRVIGERLRSPSTLRPALEVMSAVQSQPEPGLALMSMGKRDVGYDMDLPKPVWRFTDGAAKPQAVPGHWRIDGLNDQHAYLRYDPTAPSDEIPRVGELVGNGISHPCTTFDKWRWMPIVDDAFNVISAATMRF
jgi:D-serine dehydratase